MFKDNVRYGSVGWYVIGKRKKVIDDGKICLATFTDISFENTYIPNELIPILTNGFCCIPCSETKDEVLDIIGIEDVFSLPISSKSGVYDLDCTCLCVKEDNKQKVKAIVEPLLKCFYESIEVRFGILIHYQ